MTTPLNLNKILNTPLEQDIWPQLEAAIKMMGEYMAKCVKNREYKEAQKAKQKIEEANLAIKKRNVTTIQRRMEESLRRLEIKQAEEKHDFMREWEFKIQEEDRALREATVRKKELNQEELQRLKDQIELALPIHHSPDDRLKTLRHQEKKLASQGNFIEAQKIKDEIEKRELFLESKHRELREANIQEMLKELMDKQDRDMKERERHRRAKLEEILKERNKKLKELMDKHEKDLKEMKWMHEEQKRMID